jgi:hypothetical protein
VRHQRIWPAPLLALLLLPGCDKTPTSTDSPAPGSQEATAPETVSDLETALHGEPFDIAQVFFEFNTTDDDLGFQLFLDAEGWRRVTLHNPRANRLVQVLADGPLANLGITELRFESAEPSPEAVLRRFPPGEYVLRGETVEGGTLVSRARLSHDFAPAPTFTPRNGQLVDRRSTVVKWNAPRSEAVEVIIEQEDMGEVFDVTVTGLIDRLTVPPQFLRPGREYKIEVLSIAENGNRTIAESTFRTRR